MKSAISIVGLLLLVGCTATNEYQPPPPPSVNVAKPVVQNVTIYLEETGLTESVAQAVVRARVQGVLEKIEFTPGDMVENGQVLYRIEKRQYEATQQSAQAAVSSANAAVAAAQAAIEVAKSEINAAKAAVEQTQLDYARLEGLFKNNAIPQADLELAKAKRDTAAATQDGAQSKLLVADADLQEAQAQVEKANAELNQATINLGYTDVVAPISGRTSRTEVKVGNLVDNGTELVTIVDNQPMWVNFNVSERFLLRVQQNADRTEDQRVDVTNIPAFLQRTGDEGFPFSGHLDYTDPKLDQLTGTLGIRARFSNESNDLLAGLFVRIRVPLGELENAILIPEAALSRDQVGSYVLTVGADNIIERKNVTLGPKQGEFVVVRDGISADDTIVVVGIQRARPGSPVDVTMTTLTPPQTTQAVESENTQPIADQQ